MTQNFGDSGLSGSGTRSSDVVLAVEKAEERLFVVGAAGFAQDGEIRVVSADLTLSGPAEPGAAVINGDGKVPRSRPAPLGSEPPPGPGWYRK